MAAIVLVATTAMALPGELVAGEAAVFTWGNGLPRGVGLPLEAVMHLGSFVASLALALVAALTGRQRLALAAAGGWVLVRISGTIMRAVVDRSRPPGFFVDAVVRQHLPAEAGFPSGHAGNAAALAVVVSWAWPRWRWATVVVATLIGLSRIYIGVHLPLDLVGGWCLGILCGLAIVALVTRFVPDPKVLDDVR